MSESQGPGGGAKRRGATAAKHAKRGGALPSPKKAKKEQQREAIAAAAGKGAGASGAAGMPLGGLGVEQVAEAAEGAANKLAENWRVLVAIAALVAVVMGLFWLRAEQRRKAAERAWSAYAAAERGEGARDPQTWAKLAEEHAGSRAAAFMRLREADLLVRRRGEGDLAAAKRIYEELRAGGRESVAGFLAADGLSVTEATERFEPPALSGETVEGLAAARPEQPDTP